MAKGKQAEAKKSLLAMAEARLERGDVVEARRLTGLVIAGTRGRDEGAHAAQAASALGLGADSGADPGQVAQALLSRMLTPRSAYLYSLMALAVLGALVTLMWVRY